MPFRLKCCEEERPRLTGAYEIEMSACNARNVKTYDRHVFLLYEEMKEAYGCHFAILEAATKSRKTIPAPSGNVT